MSFFLEILSKHDIQRCGEKETKKTLLSRGNGSDVPNLLRKKNNKTELQRTGSLYFFILQARQMLLMLKFMVFLLGESFINNRLVLRKKERKLENRLRREKLTFLTTPVLSAGTIFVF